MGFRPRNTTRSASYAALKTRGGPAARLPSEWSTVIPTSPAWWTGWSAVAWLCAAGGPRQARITTRITHAGLELLEALNRPVEEFNHTMLSHLGKQQLRVLIKLLEAAREHAG